MKTKNLILCLLFVAAKIGRLSSQDLYVGSNSSGQTTNIDSGTNGYSSSYVGYLQGDSNNLLAIGNADTLLTNSGDIFIGYWGNSNSMVISNGAQVINGNGTIGYNYTASDNSVLVSDAGTLWTNGGDLSVGIDSSGNALVISGGAQVVASGQNFGCAIGGNADSSNNLVLVTGANSGLTIGDDLYVGASGSYNSLTISNGGTVAVTGLDTGVIVGSDSTSSQNSVLVTDSGSTLTTSMDLIVGVDGAGGLLTISNGGSATVYGIYYGTVIGLNADSSNNAVVITGRNADGTVSSLDSGMNLYVGYGGPSNSLTIADGGEVENNVGFLGYTSSSQNNSVTVSGNDSFWINNGDLTVGMYGGGNTLTISNGGTVVSGQSSYGGAIGLDFTSSNNSVLVTGTNSDWMSEGDLAVGYAGSGNNLTISNGATVTVLSFSFGTAIGLNSTSSNNSVLVTGTNSIWMNSKDFAVGYAGGGNNLTISNGGTVSNGLASYGGALGVSSNSSNNSVLVSGTNSIWTSSGDLSVGVEGSGNTLTISNGGTVANGRSDYGGAVGVYYPSSNNAVLVTGTNSLWTNSVLLTLGVGGPKNSLTISNGGEVVNTIGYLGYNSSSSNNTVLVTGNNSLWTNSSTLYVGFGSPKNSLTISNGGEVVNTIGYLGYNGSSSNNTVTVSGSNSLWTNSSTLYVGYIGSKNTLNVSNGGRVADSVGYLGYNGSSSNNTVTVSGSNSLWTNSGTFTLGVTGHNNSLTISNGGQVVDTVGYLGGNVVSSNNTVLVTGSNSLWTNSSTLYVGYQGSGTLTVANGGTVTANGITIASGSVSKGTLNIGTLGGSDAASTISTATIAFGSGTGTINFNQTNSLTLTSSISGAGILQQLGSGTTILTGSDSFSGGISDNEGTLSVNNTSSLGTGTISVSTGGTLQFTGVTGTLTNSMKVGNGTGTIQNTGGGTLTISGFISKQNAILKLAGGSYHVAGQISGGSPGDGLFNSDLVISNATVTLLTTNSYYGPTDLLAGSTLINGIANALPVTTVLNIGGVSDAAGVTNAFSLAGFNQTIAGLNNTGSATALVYDSTGGGTLTITGNSGFSGSIGGGLMGSFMDLVVSGGSTVATLTGNNTYTGSTWITNGATLDLSSTGQLSGTTNVVVNGGTLLLGGNGKNNPLNTNAALTLNGATISMGGLTATIRTTSQTLASLTLTGASTIDFGNLPGTSSLTVGSITMNGNTLSVYNYNGTSLYGTSSSTGGTGQYTTLYDLNTNSLSPVDLANISFYSGNGTGFLGSGTFQGNEIIAVPEPEVIVSMLLLLAWMLFSQSGRASLVIMTGIGNLRRLISTLVFYCKSF